MSPESAASKISPERLKKYADFVEVHSDLQPDGTLVYNPEKALVGLLSILTPDPKGIVLAGMQDIIYSSNRQLYNGTVLYLNDHGIPGSIFPLTHNSVWDYLEFRDKDREKIDGSLVKIGAVVREVVTHEDLETLGYMRSEAGRDLGISLVYKAIEFVNKTKRSDIPHKFNSLWKLLGAINSPSNQRRPWIVYNIVDHLVANPGVNRLTDIYEDVRNRNINISPLSHNLNLLGDVGLIDYTSPLASSNDLTRMFYEEVLISVREVAFSLTQISSPVSSRDSLKIYIQNYQEERSQVGLRGGEMIREGIILVLTKQAEMKLSHIAQEFNQSSKRKLQVDTFHRHLNYLISQGLVIKTKAGFYRLKENTN